MRCSGPSRSLFSDDCKAFLSILYGEPGVDFASAVLYPSRFTRPGIRRTAPPLLPCIYLTSTQSDVYAREHDRKSDSMEDAARTIAKAFGNCLSDRTSPIEQSRKWGVYYIVGLVLKSYFRASHRHLLCMLTSTILSDKTDITVKKYSASS